MARKDELGKSGEQRASDYLEAQGYRVLDRNWRCAQGELDIVALHGNAIVFVEVKTRSTTAYGHPFEAIDERKRERLWRLAHAWAKEHPLGARGMQLRLDAIGIVGADPTTGPLEHLVDLR